MNTLLSLLLITIAVILSSCTPTHYVVDTTPYEDQINSNPSEVVISPDDVTPVGGFKLEAGTTIRTDQGDINLSDSGLSGNVVIDLRDSPPSAANAGK